MALLPKGSLIFGLARKRPDQNPKETKKTKGDFLDFIV
jgi:hypothetical protein